MSRIISLPGRGAREEAVHVAFVAIGPAMAFFIIVYFPVDKEINHHFSIQNDKFNNNDDMHFVNTQTYIRTQKHVHTHSRMHTHPRLYMNVYLDMTST